MTKKELRCCVAEAIGTFAIVFFGCGAIALGVAGHVGANIVFGATVAAMVYALGHVSCAHFNPAVTLGFYVVRRFPLRMVFPYVVSQCVGAVVAAFLVSLFAPVGSDLGATVPVLPLPGVIGVEAVLTFFLMLVIVSVATDSRVHGAVPGAAIGLTVMVAGLMAGPLTGSSMNPARSLGPALFSGVGPLWVYFVGPCVGAVCGAFAYEFVTGRAKACVPKSCCPDC